MNPVKQNKQTQKVVYTDVNGEYKHSIGNKNKILTKGN